MAISLILALALQSAPAPTLNPSLEPLAFLVGSCWRGTFGDGRQTDTHCFTPMLGGAFVRDVHVVEGASSPYSGETVYRLDRDTGEIWFHYYASNGTHISGQVVPTETGLEIPAHAFNDGIGETEMRSRWTRDGADAYRVFTERQEGESWRPVMQLRMVRVGPAPPR